MRGPRTPRHTLTALLSVVLLWVSSCGKSVEQPSGAQGPQNGGPCAAPLMACNGVCVDIAGDAVNCGACAALCPPGDSCVDGVCRSTGCPAERTECGGLCVDLATNPLNCGSCNTPCVPPQGCVGGACACLAPEFDCNGECVDVQNSDAHCGACNSPCAPDETCVAGVCNPRCAPPYDYCDGAGCVDLSTDTTACGACGHACQPNEECVTGTCRCSSDTGHELCGGLCANTQASALNCGSCGNICPAGARCELGVCTSCRAGLFYCPPATGDPLQTCLAQARTPVPGPASDAGDPDVTPIPNPAPLSPDRECQCNHCLVELADCVADPQCAATWQCAMTNACTVPCWGSLGICATSAGGCWKFCPPSTGSTQTAARAEALLNCTKANGCGI